MPETLAPEPDQTGTWTRAEFENMLYTDATFAEFNGVNWRLGVYLMERPDSYSPRAVVVAPMPLGPAMPFATTQVRLWHFTNWDEQPAAFQRACLWALAQTVKNLEEETK